MNEEFDENDPGNVLQAAIDLAPALSEKFYRNLGELLYTASERGILPFSIDPDTARVLVAIVAVAQKAKPSEINEMRM